MAKMARTCAHALLRLPPPPASSARLLRPPPPPASSLTDLLRTCLLAFQVPLVKMLLVCLLHQCSPDAAARQTALELASALARNPQQPLDAGNALLTNEFVTLSSCVAATYKYSQVLAVQCSAFLGEPLLRELVSTAKLLPDVQNESMLHMIMPWIAHFGKGC